MSVLDLAPVVTGSTPRAALRRTVELAQAAEQFGYCRYWLAEHHGLPGVASAAPAVVAGQVAARTQVMRVGSGGVMLANHSPLVVAEQFGTLEAFFPGRIDLGMARASGATEVAADVLRHSAQPTSHLADLLSELLNYFNATPEVADQARAVPAEGNKPETWLLGSGLTSARIAGSLGLPYAFAHHLKPDNAEPAARLYRDCFSPGVLSQPRLMLSVAAVVGDSDDHANWLAGPTRLKYLMKRHDRSVLLPTPEDADRYPYSAADRSILALRFGPSGDVVVGSARTACRRLDELVNALAADELMITTRVHGQDDQQRSYQLLAAARDSTRRNS